MGGDVYAIGFYIPRDVSTGNTLTHTYTCITPPPHTYTYLNMDLCNGFSHEFVGRVHCTFR